MDTSPKPFIAAYYVLKTLREETGAKLPFISLWEDGNAYISMDAEDYQKCKNLAERLMLSNKWFMDVYGHYCLSSRSGLVVEEKLENDLERTDN